MASKRKAEESLAGPSKKRSVDEGARARDRGVRDEELSTAFKAVAGAIVPALTELASRMAEIGGSETILVENEQIPQLAEDLNRGRMDGEGAKEWLERGKMLQLQEAAWYMAACHDLAQKERAQEELLIHTKLDVMQLVRTHFRKPDETDDEVRLFEMPNDQEAMEATGERTNPSYTAGPGRGRVYLETVAMWDDWCERRDAVVEEDRGNVLPRSYSEVKAAKLAKEEERARATEAQQAAEATEKTAETERPLERAETRRHTRPKKPVGKGKKRKNR
ncbi:hypothetical protein MMC22_006078 [Lobaria immixta]|nr:hypothetical protein [Lobaria immixta]